MAIKLDASMPAAPLIALTVLSIALFGCSKTEPQPEPEPLRFPYSGERLRELQEEVIAMGMPAKLVHLHDHFESFSESIKRAPSMTIYEGLPQRYDAQFNEELKRTKTVVLNGRHFYAQPVAATPETLDRVRTYIADASHFFPFGMEISECEEFHSDWCVVFGEGEEAINAHICLGCNEFEAFDVHKLVMTCSMQRPREFRAILDPLHVNLPEDKE